MDSAIQVKLVQQTALVNGCSCYKSVVIGEAVFTKGVCRYYAITTFLLAEAAAFKVRQIARTS